MIKIKCEEKMICKKCNECINNHITIELSNGVLFLPINVKSQILIYRPDLINSFYHSFNYCFIRMNFENTEYHKAYPTVVIN